MREIKNTPPIDSAKVNFLKNRFAKYGDDEITGYQSFKYYVNELQKAFDDKKTKMNVVGSIFGLTKSIGKLALNATGCAIKNAPKAVVAVAAAKRELVTAIEDEIHEQNKQAQKDALDEKIKQLGLKV